MPQYSIYSVVLLPLIAHPVSFPKTKNSLTNWLNTTVECRCDIALFGLNNAVWVDKRSRDILNAPYFHVVFTMPQELHALIYQNQTLLYSLFYRAVAETLQELSSDEKYLGAQAGFLSLLHTWGQDLHYHLHIHTKSKITKRPVKEKKPV